MSFNAKLNKVFLSEIKNFFDTTEETMNISDELCEKLQAFLNISTGPASKKKEPKEPRAKREIVYSEEDKCTALKKDHTRCKGKKYPTGTNPELCFLHNKNGANNGYYTKVEFENEVPEEESEIETEQVA